MKWPLASLALVVFALACGGDEDAADTELAADSATARQTPGGADEGAGGGATTFAGGATTASSAEATGAPSPPSGYALDSRPADSGQLARIEYASPLSVAEVAAFYDGQIQSARRVELDLAGDNLIAYGLSENTTLTAASTQSDVNRLLDQRTEPVVIVIPWKIQRNDPLINDLSEVGGQEAQIEALLNTKSKVTVIYAVP
ncbi:MAG: hypothetical protein ABR559_00140 [Gemmatimonadota bacterium]